jgi:hypothetical protein
MRYWFLVLAILFGQFSYGGEKSFSSDTLQANFERYAVLKLTLAYMYDVELTSQKNPLKEDEIIGRNQFKSNFCFPYKIDTNYQIVLENARLFLSNKDNHWDVSGIRVFRGYESVLLQNVINLNKEEWNFNYSPFEDNREQIVRDSTLTNLKADWQGISASPYTDTADTRSTSSIAVQEVVNDPRSFKLLDFLPWLIALLEFIVIVFILIRMKRKAMFKPLMQQACKIIISL